MAFRATKQKVLNRGIPPDSFLQELIAWGRTAPDEIFAPNQNADVYSNVVGVLGPWQGLPHRRAAMLEVMRVLAGFEIILALERRARSEQSNIGYADHDGSRCLAGQCELHGFWAGAQGPCSKESRLAGWN